MDLHEIAKLEQSYIALRDLEATQGAEIRRLRAEVERLQTIIENLKRLVGIGDVSIRRLRSGNKRVYMVSCYGHWRGDSEDIGEAIAKRLDAERARID